jgi:hypothetical protein
MKRFLHVGALVCALAALCLGQTIQTSTPNLGFQLPALGQLLWNTPVNGNFKLIDSLLGGTTSMPASFWNKALADVAVTADSAGLNIGKFTDTGRLSAWPVAYTMIGPGSELETVTVKSETPWLNCTSGGSISVIDDLGHNITTLTLADNYGSGSTPYSYMTGISKPLSVIAASGAALLHPVFTSPTGCTQYATGVRVELKVDQLSTSISPLTASVATAGTVQFSGSTLIATDPTVNWSVESEPSAHPDCTPHRRRLGRTRSQLRATPPARQRQAPQ